MRCSFVSRMLPHCFEIIDPLLLTTFPHFSSGLLPVESVNFSATGDVPAAFDTDFPTGSAVSSLACHSLPLPQQAAPMAEGEAAPVEAPRPTKKRSPNRLVVEEAMNDDNSVPLAMNNAHRWCYRNFRCKIFRIYMSTFLYSLLVFVLFAKECSLSRVLGFCGLMLLVAVKVLL